MAAPWRSCRWRAVVAATLLLGSAGLGVLAQDNDPVDTISQNGDVLLRDPGSENDDEEIADLGTTLPLFSGLLPPPLLYLPSHQA